LKEQVRQEIAKSETQSKQHALPPPKSNLTPEQKEALLKGEKVDIPPPRQTQQQKQQLQPDQPQRQPAKRGRKPKGS